MCHLAKNSMILLCVVFKTCVLCIFCVFFFKIVFSFDLCFVNLCVVQILRFFYNFFLYFSKRFLYQFKGMHLHTQTHKARKHTSRALLRDNTYTQHAKLSATLTRKYIINILKSAFNIRDIYQSFYVECAVEYVR